VDVVMLEHSRAGESEGTICDFTVDDKMSFQLYVSMLENNAPVIIFLAQGGGGLTQGNLKS